MAAAAWLRWAAILGYAACGIVYIAIGTIAAAVAMGFAERPAGPPRVMRMIEDQPFGKLILVALSLGFLGYAALNISGAFRDPEKHGHSLKGLLKRAGDAFTGALYVALAVAAVRIIAAPSREGGRIVEIWATGVLALPYGAVLLGSIGALLLTAGASLVYRALAKPFQDTLDRRTLPSWLLKMLTAAARFGTLARGVILATSGILVIRAAVTQQPTDAGGIGDALSAVETTLFGAWLLGFAALGFIAYGAYQMAKMRYRRVSIR